MAKKNEIKISFSIVIPNFNGEDLLKDNLPSVIKASNQTSNRIDEIIVVDDHSEDDSVGLIKNEFSTVKLVKHTRNRGFSAAVNTGARTSSSDFIVLLNTDVRPSENFLKPVIKHFKNEEVFAVSLHEKGYGWAKGTFKEGFIVHEPGKESKNAHLSFWASGGSGVFRRKMWMELKGMDQELFTPFYWEDVDLSYRAHKRGWLIYWEPEAKVEHAHEQTIGKIDKTYKSRIEQRNHLIFNWKNITSNSMFRKHLRGLIRRILLHPGYLKIVYMALKQISLIRKKRETEKKQSRVSDEAVLARF